MRNEISQFLTLNIVWITRQELELDVQFAQHTGNLSVESSHPANTEYSRIFAGVMSSEYLREIFREYSLNIATLIRIFANIRSGNVQRIFTKNIQGMFFVLCPANIYEKYSENIP